MFKTIAIIIVVAVIVVLALASRRPDQFKVERRVTIKAAPEKIFPYLNDLHKFAAWSPFEKLDPAMQRRYNDVAAGPGASYEWEGNSKAGQGRMEIVESTPASRVLIKLDFVKPMAANNMVEFRLTPTGDQTEVSWTMTGAAPFFVKIIHVFFDMDRMVGKDFESGLDNLRKLAEQP